MNRTTVIEQNLHTLTMAHERFLGTEMKHIQLKETDTVVGLLSYLETIFDNIAEDYDSDLEYQFYSTLSKIKLLLGVPTDFAVK